MATTDLNLEEPGSIAKPGPIGRLARLGFGVASLYYVFGLLTVLEHPLSDSGSIRPLILNGILPGLFLVSYVVNIGFSRAWKKWPAFASAGLILGAGLVGYSQTGVIETTLLARTAQFWEMYVFLHLGVSFALASVIGTPGCEMRSLPHFFSLITGKPTKEHVCPVGPLAPIDRWERGDR